VDGRDGDGAARRDEVKRWRAGQFQKQSQSGKSAALGEVKSGLLLDVVIRRSAPLFELFGGERFCLHCRGRPNLEGDCLAGECFDEPADHEETSAVPKSVTGFDDTSSSQYAPACDKQLERSCSRTRPALVPPPLPTPTQAGFVSSWERCSFEDAGWRPRRCRSMISKKAQ
jgi:hypothetical protein